MPDSDLLLVLLGYAALFFFLFFWQRVRDPFLGSPLVFLDKLCISQTDPVKKEQGILGLGGFLRVSQRLIVLWSPRYFSRAEPQSQSFSETFRACERSHQDS